MVRGRGHRRFSMEIHGLQHERRPSVTSTAPDNPGYFRSENAVRKLPFSCGAAGNGWQVPSRIAERTKQRCIATVTPREWHAPSIVGLEGITPSILEGGPSTGRGRREAAAEGLRLSTMAQVASSGAVSPEPAPPKRPPSWGLGAKGLRFRAVGIRGYARAKRPGTVLRKRACSFLVRISRAMAA